MTSANSSVKNLNLYVRKTISFFVALEVMNAYICSLLHYLKRKSNSVKFSYCLSFCYYFILFPLRQSSDIGKLSVPEAVYADVVEVDNAYFTPAPLPTKQPWYRTCGSSVLNYIKSITWKGWLAITIIILLLILLVLALFLLPWADWLGDFLNWIQHLGYWAPILLAEMYIACTLLFIPGTILTLGAGIIFVEYGTWQAVVIGTITVSIGSTIGACGAFLLGKTLARGWVEAKIKDVKIFKAVDIAIAKQSWLVVLLLRLSPVVPFNLLNYALGITKVDFIPYFLMSWIGMLPATIVYVWIGTTIGQIALLTGGKADTSNWVTYTLFGVGLVATIIVLVVITIYSKRMMTKLLNSAEAEVIPRPPEKVLHHDSISSFATSSTIPRDITSLEEQERLFDENDSEIGSPIIASLKLTESTGSVISQKKC